MLASWIRVRFIDLKFWNTGNSVKFPSVSSCFFFGGGSLKSLVWLDIWIFGHFVWFGCIHCIYIWWSVLCLFWFWICNTKAGYTSQHIFYRFYIYIYSRYYNHILGYAYTGCVLFLSCIFLVCVVSLYTYMIIHGFITSCRLSWKTYLTVVYIYCLLCIYIYIISVYIIYINYNCKFVVCVGGLDYGYLGFPYERDCYLGSPLESQTTNSNHQFTSSWIYYIHVFTYISIHVNIIYIYTSVPVPTPWIWTN